MITTPEEEASKMVLAALSAITSRFNDDKSRFFRPEEIVFSIPPREEKRKGPKVKRGPMGFAISEGDVFLLLKPYVERGLVFTRGDRSQVSGAVDPLMYRVNDVMPHAIAEEVGPDRLQEFRRYSGLRV